jgi:hypothetical protein
MISSVATLSEILSFEAARSEASRPILACPKLHFAGIRSSHLHQNRKRWRSRPRFRTKKPSEEMPFAAVYVKVWSYVIGWLILPPPNVSHS